MRRLELEPNPIGLLKSFARPVHLGRLWWSRRGRHEDNEML